jgi:hypothetical protein
MARFAIRTAQCGGVTPTTLGELSGICDTMTRRHEGENSRKDNKSRTATIYVAKTWYIRIQEEVHSSDASGSPHL